MATSTAEVAPLAIKALGRGAAASPLRYPGGKAALAGFFADIIKRIGIRSATYVEPYAGGAGAGIVLLQQELVRRVVINDIDPAVYCFWKSVTENSEKFAALVVDAELNVDEWRRQQAIYREADETDPLTLGFAFFYLNRTNRSGILNAGPIGGVRQTGNYKIDARYNRDQLAERIVNIGALSDRISVSSVDGMSVIRKHLTKKSSFIYIDPPYVEMGGSLYLNAFTHRDHADLAQLLTTGRDGNWVLTYDPADFIRRLYKEHGVHEYQLSYSAHRAGKANELLIASRPVANLLAVN
ncbi:DNA adenine methylase [Mycolicibacterium mucogenicum]|uniref:DNA adenine methylase n=1 Tax=Mycolicibacterium mucogenicum TaxID=56689 RepID=UPI000AEDFAC6|nr:DNA adenine methylase [Mycolicibacterium mucogenicum]KAB7755183.1 DNA methyltransferase [Mycolicibacterium mucogenicum DSM 44124]